MPLTEEQILTLAPDESSRKSGKDLANPSKWVSKGVSVRALWGECQGSGSKPYRTQVDLSSIAFKCSCPSRKFPCKHGLGLLLFHARSGTSFNETTEPDWVIEWLSKRNEKEEKKVSNNEKPLDEAAQAKRQKARQQKVEDGIEEIRLWIMDIVRNGILGIPEKGPVWFEAISKRMVDAQSPGLAAIIRSISNINYYEEGWQQPFMNQLLTLYMVTEGYRNIQFQDELVQQDIKSWIGFTYNQEELKERDGIKDDWMVLSKQSIEQDALTTEKFWLYGIRTHQYALILQFKAGFQPVTLTLTPGTLVEAELVYFPSSIPLRAIIKKQFETKVPQNISGFTDWRQVAENETTLSASIPFRQERACYLEQAVLVQYEGLWWLQDRNKEMMRIKQNNRVVWRLLSISGGAPFDVAVIGMENIWEPVGIWFQGKYSMV